MKKLLLFALLLLATPAQAQILGTTLPCNQQVSFSQAAVGLTQIIPALSPSTPSKIISWCGWAVNAGAAAGTAQLKMGFGGNCAIGTTDVTKVITLGINGVYVDHIPFAAYSLSPGADMCLVTTGTGPTQVQIFFTIN